MAYEPRDLSARGVMGFLIALAISVLIAALALWGVYKYLARGALRASQINPMTTTVPAVPGSTAVDPATRFPNPRLQPDPAADMNKFRLSEDQWLNSYGWVDQAAGKVHIPIGRAMDLLAQTGLPTRRGAPPPAATTPEPAAGAAGGINVK